jgi:hypothetical protein
VKQPIVSNSLPIWATKLSPAATPMLLDRLLTVPATPVNPFGNPAKPKVKPLDNGNKIVNDLRILDMSRTITNGVIDLVAKKQKKDAERLKLTQSTGLVASPTVNFTFDQPLTELMNKNSAPVVVVTSNLDKPTLPPSRIAPTPQPTNSGLANNSTLKVVHITADGTAILTDGQNNYYSLPPNNARNNQEKVLPGAAKPAQQKRSARRNR